MSLIRQLILFVILSLASACGGSGGSGSPDPSPSPEPAPAPPPEPSPEDPNSPEDPPAPAPESANDYTLFESGHVRPLARSPSGARLFAVNTPDQRLEIFTVDNGRLSAEASVTVGLEPVAVAARNENEVWVVNHLSDSVSVVRLDAPGPRVVATLQVGDEPRDIVFAGADRERAFISAARRGQNHPDFDPAELKTPGLGRADLWVFDARTRNREHILTLFADIPRALAVNADGSRVYAATFLSGNQTTTLLNEPEVAGAKPGPHENHEGATAPATGLIVGFDGERWVDEEGGDWSERVLFNLPDLDLFTIDASAETPAVIATHSGVGTTLFNVAVNPQTGAVYTSNTDARNRVRFEGPGESATTVRGHIAESRISVLSDGAVHAVHLNPHVDFELPEGASAPAGMRELSLAQPQQMQVSADGNTLYLAAFGSNRVARIPTADLEADRYDPATTEHLRLPGGGPSGLMLSADERWLFAFSRYANAISVFDLANDSLVQTVALFNPEPGPVQRGRRLLYDAEYTSANGTESCGSCHIFSDVDALAWDLGNPDGNVSENPNEFVPLRSPTQGVFHPMKGPMSTQTLRGIADSGPMHWRGDRTGRNRATVRGELESLEAAAFKEFNPAFVELVGREEPLAPDELQDLTDFALAIVPPPNAIRNLDNSLTPDQAEGRRVFLEEPTTGGALTCDHCHVLDPANKHFGTAGLMTNEGPGITEDFKVVHLRNVYSKVGMFGESIPRPGQQARFMGDQIRGFGLLHDGGIDTVSNFLASSVFGFDSDAQREQVVDFVFAFDGNLAPVVGQQVTIDANSEQADIDRLQLLVDQAGTAGNCELVVHGRIDGTARGALLDNNGQFATDRAQEPELTLDRLLELASEPGQALTFTCVPFGSGERVALDRDRDGILNGDESG